MGLLYNQELDEFISPFLWVWFNFNGGLSISNLNLTVAWFTAKQGKNEKKIKNQNFSVLLLVNKKGKRKKIERK